MPDRPRGTIDAPIDRHPHARDKMAVRAGGREAVTHWEVLERYLGADGTPVASLLACRLETGRTHQIRVHLAAIGHPLLGDAVYGPGFKTKADQLPPAARAALAALGRQALHAYLLAIEHPSPGNVLEFRSELPADLRSFTPQPRCTGHIGLTAKVRANQGLRHTRRGHGDVTPSSLPFAPICPVCCACDQHFAVAARTGTVGSGSGGAHPPAGHPGANYWRALLWPALRLCRS